MLSYGNMKNFGGVETPHHPSRGGGASLKKKNIFQKVAICVFVYYKTILKMLGNDT